LTGKEKRGEILSMFKYYVPQKGHDETTAEKVFDYGLELGTFFTPQNKWAEGRISIFDDPVSYIFSNAQSVICEAVNNELQQSIYRVALEAESTAREKEEKPAVTVSNTWFQK
jgi:hypothetical protein